MQQTELQSLTAKHKGSIDGSLKAFHWNSRKFWEHQATTKQKKRVMDRTKLFRKLQSDTAKGEDRIEFEQRRRVQISI